MKTIQTLFVFFLIALGKLGIANEPGSPTALVASKNILVLLEKNISSATFEAKGAYEISDPKRGSKITSSFSGKRHEITVFPEGLRWGEGFPGIHQIRITPKKDGAIFLNGVQYQGSLVFYKIQDKLSVVNDLPVESYLHSLLSQEFSYPLENEVMASVAIAARTSAYYQMEKNKSAYWHVDAKEVGYMGSALISLQSPICSAINSTRNLVLVYPHEGNKVPFMAYWTEHSAGKTAPAPSIFRKEELGPKEGLEAPHAALAREDSKWYYAISKERLAHLLQIENIASIDLFVEPTSKKAYGVRIKDKKGKNVDMDFVKFQKCVGKTSILSNDLSVSSKGSDVIFHGHGKGLGVGLCLYSASAMAQNGEMADKILAKFYPESELTQLSLEK